MLETKKVKVNIRYINRNINEILLKHIMEIFNERNNLILMILHLITFLIIEAEIV